MVRWLDEKARLQAEYEGLLQALLEDPRPPRFAELAPRIDVLSDALSQAGRRLQLLDEAIPSGAPRTEGPAADPAPSPEVSAQPSTETSAQSFSETSARPSTEASAQPFPEASAQPSPEISLQPEGEAVDAEPADQPEDPSPRPEPAAPRPSPKVPRHARVATLMAEAREPRTPRDFADLFDELEQLEALVDEDRLEKVRKLDPEDQRAWLKLTAAWSRHIGQLPDVQRPQRERLRTIFGVAAEFSKVERPGFVHGLAADHEPESKSWLEDAKQAFSALKAAQEAPAA